MKSRAGRDRKPTKVKRVLNPSVARIPEWCTVLQLFSRENLCEEDQALAQPLIEAFRLESMEAFDALLPTLDPEEFIGTDFQRFICRRQFLALVRKLPFGSPGARRRKALDGLKSDELINLETNLRLMEFHHHPERLAAADPELFCVLQLARRKVVDVMGHFDLSTLVSRARPGNGTSIGTLDSQLTSLPAKLGHTRVFMTPACRDLFDHMVRGPWAELIDGYDCVDFNRSSFVPKNWKTDRLIAIEPSFNVWCQLGAHEVLASRLAATGNSITDQTRNQELARVGSITNSYATLDLSSASNSLTTACVLTLLQPPGCHNPWYSYLCQVRSPTMEVEGTPTRMEMFSTMGNGATFVLETIIFLCVARAVHSRLGGNSPSVYGDDIICDVSNVALVQRTLGFLGFRLNTEKSFSSGPFRESCGADWYNGKNVTPVYVDRLPLKKADIYNFVNHLPDWFHWGAVVEFLVDEMSTERSWRADADLSIHYVDELASSTAGFRISRHELFKRKLVRFHKDHQRYYCFGLRFRPNKTPFGDLSLYAASLHGFRKESEEWEDDAFISRRVAGRWAVNRVFFY